MRPEEQERADYNEENQIGTVGEIQRAPEPPQQLAIRHGQHSKGSDGLRAGAVWIIKTTSRC